MVSCDFSPDGALLAVASYKSSTGWWLDLWDPYTADLLSRVEYVDQTRCFKFYLSRTQPYLYNICGDMFGTTLFPQCTITDISFWDKINRNLKKTLNSIADI